MDVDSAKFLGIVIDNRLNWVEHIKYISRKFANIIGIIIKVRKSFASETILNLYDALIFFISHLNISLFIFCVDLVTLESL